MKVNKVHLDFETYSEADIKAVGAMRYSEDKSTQAIIASFALGDGPVVGVDLTKPGSLEKMTPFFDAVAKGTTVCSHNSQFERSVWQHVCKHWPVQPKPMQWSCTSSRASAMALPPDLASVGVALGLPMIKDPVGLQLIHRFSKPQKDGSRITAKEDPAGFKRFIEYCRQDTVVERGIDHVLPDLIPYEQKVFALDYQINQRGVPLDIPLIHTAIEFIQETSRNLEKKAIALTGVKTSQRDRLLEWLQDQGSEMETLQAAEVERAIADPETPKQVREILENRIECSRAGTKKLKTMLTCVSPDGRVRGAFWYHSASPGRWGSSRVQFHNFSKPDPLYPQEDVISLLKIKSLDLLYDRPLTAIAKCIRGFIQAPAEHEFAIADYAAIEARDLAWLADEEWLIKAFRAGKDVYRIMAARIFHIRYEDVNEAQRFFGKQTILGAGYGMGIPKFMATCAKFGVIITEAEAQKAIQGYRESVPNIAGEKGIWKRVERAALRAVLTGKPQTICGDRLTFMVDTLPNGFQVLYIVLPSDRRLCYPQPRVENIEKWGMMRPTLIFKSLHRYMWVDEETYGGKLVENIIQAIARDQLADGLVAVDQARLPIVAHVHDEIIAEVPKGSANIREFEALVCQPRDWARSIPTAANGKLVSRYAK